MGTIRLTVAQALVRFLAAQYTERDGAECRTIAGAFGIFGHGNVAGVGQALLQSEVDDPAMMPYILARNEQAMVHTATAYARASDRLTTWACTSSIGPGATNMVTGAALATINRLPVLLLPSDVFATRRPDPVLQQLEHPLGPETTVNDTFRPVSRFFDRVDRPEQLPTALLGAMRVLTDPAETGAVTISLPQDVQAEAADWPLELFERRVWHVGRPVAEPAALRRAVDRIRAARRPLIVAGGGVHYAGATAELGRLAAATGIPVAETQAGKGALPYDHESSLGAIGSTGTTAANAIAAEADLVLGIGTRFSDFTTASKTVFQDPDLQVVNVNVASVDAAKLSGTMVVADAKDALERLMGELDGYTVDAAYRQRVDQLRRTWDDAVEAAYQREHRPLPAQSEVIGAVNEAVGASGVVVCAAGSMPGDLHKLWRTRAPGTYHVEYGYSCMGYEIAGALGVKLADPDREVFALVGDGSYLMLAQELVTAVQERLEIIVVLVQNHGFASIGALSEQVGSQRFGTRYRYRDEHTGRLEGERLPVDLAANAASLGARVIDADGIAGFREALSEARAHRGGPVVVHVETDPLAGAPSSESWWDVPVAEVSDLQSTQRARANYDEQRVAQRPHLRP